MPNTTRYLLLPLDELQEVAEKEASIEADRTTSIALELLEYRKIFGPLGCQWLVLEKK